MKNKGVIFFVPLVINLVGVALAMLYGMFGGSGGDTTEGVFLAVMGTGWSTLVLCIVIPLRRYKEFNAPRNWVVIITALTCAILELNAIGWIPETW